MGEAEARCVVWVPRLIVILRLKLPIVFEAPWSSLPVILGTLFERGNHEG
jgi:hypothetical protein